MDAEAALNDLLEISSQVETAVIVGAGGEIEAASIRDEERARGLGRAARQLLDAAADYAPGELRQVEVATADGSVFVVREGDRAVAATTARSPTAGLVFYDLKTCLRTIGANGDGDADAAG